MSDNFTRWKAAYKLEMLAAIKRNPGEWALQRGETPESFAEYVGEKMAQTAFRDGFHTINVSTNMRRAATKCGAESTTIKALNEWIKQ